jgi:hypothetical protein
MKTHEPPELDMTLEGEFVSPPVPPVSTRIMFWAIIVAVVAGAVVIAALALWLAMLILPVAIGAALIGWGMMRYKLWRAGQLGSSQRNLWQPPPGR